MKKKIVPILVLVFMIHVEICRQSIENFPKQSHAKLS